MVHADLNAAGFDTDALMPSDLRCFMILYRVGSLAETARQIPMSVQGVSKSLRRLETSLGVELFSRDRQGLSPTPYGEALFSLALRWAVDVGSLKRDFLKIGGERRRILHVGMVMGCRRGVGSDLERTFEDRHPDVDVEVTEGADTLVELALIEGECDIALTSAPYDKHFISHDLLSVPMYALVPEGHVLHGRSSVCAADLVGEVIGMSDPSFKFNSVVMDAIASAGGAPADVFETADPHWLVKLGLEGEFVAIIPEFLVDDTVLASQAATVPFSDIGWKFGSSTLSGKVLEDIEREYLAFLADECRKSPLARGTHAFRNRFSDSFVR